MHEPEILESKAPAEAPSLVEHLVAVGFGGLLFVLGVSLWVWGWRLGAAGWRTAAGWPPGLGNLLFPLLLISVFVGFGSWRILRLSLPPKCCGLSLGRWVLVVFGLGAGAGVLM